MGEYSYYVDINLYQDIYNKDGDFDKTRYINNHIKYMLDRTHSMFKYENLPAEVDERMLELMLQTQGSVFFTKVNDKYYVFRAGLGGEPDPYYRPTLAVVANPALKLSKSYEIGKDGILCLNDTMLVGLIPLFSLYGSLLAENLISMRCALINNRQSSIITANTDAGKQSAELYQKRLIEGKMSVIADKGLEEGVRINPARVANDNALTSLIEHQQYLKASEWNEIGINANYNMKRESITSSESDLNNESLFPTIDAMLECRKKWVEEVNELFGLDISVDLSSVWKHKKQASELEIITAVNDLAESLPSESSSLDLNGGVENGIEETETEEKEESFEGDNVDDNRDDSMVSDSSDSVLTVATDNMAEVVKVLTEDVLVDLEIAVEEEDKDESDKDEDGNE